MAVQPKASISFFRILVTGADGFVGRHFLDALAKRIPPGCRIIIGTRTRQHDIAFDQVVFDLIDGPMVEEAIASVRPDLIVHLAAQSSVGAGAAGETWATNLGGSLALARAVAVHVPDATLLFVSSVEVYGSSFNDGRVAESSLLKPITPYGRSKAAGEAMFADVLPPETRLIVVRPCNHSGPGQDVRFVIPSFAMQIAAAELGGPTILRVGNLDAARDFLDVRDVADAYVALIEAAPQLPSRTTLNLASGHVVRIRQLLDNLLAHAVVALEIEVDQAKMRPSEVPVAAIDASLFHTITGWFPQISIGTMLLDILAACRRSVSPR